MFPGGIFLKQHYLPHRGPNIVVDLVTSLPFFLKSENLVFLSLRATSPSSVQAAVETVARKRKASSSSSSSSSSSPSRPSAGAEAPLPLSLVGPPPPAHPTFLPVRLGLLYSPVMMRAVRVVLSNYAGKVLFLLCFEDVCVVH